MAVTAAPPALRTIRIVQQPPAKPWSEFAILAAILPLALIGAVAFWWAVPHPSGAPLLGLAFFEGVLVFLGALGVRSMRSETYPQPSEIRVLETGVSVIFPGRGERTVLWGTADRLSLTQLEGVKGADGEDQMCLTGPWPPLLWISFADGMGLLDVARKHGASVTRKPDGRRPYQIHYVITAPKR